MIVFASALLDRNEVASWPDASVAPAGGDNASLPPVFVLAKLAFWFVTTLAKRSRTMPISNALLTASATCAFGDATSVLIAVFGEPATETTAAATLALLALKVATTERDCAMLLLSVV